MSMMMSTFQHEECVCEEQEATCRCSHTHVLSESCCRSED